LFVELVYLSVNASIRKAIGRKVDLASTLA